MTDRGEDQAGSGADLSALAAVILAAGQGRRMRRALEQDRGGGDIPDKLLLPLAGKPLLHYVLETVPACGFGEVLAVTDPARPGPAALCQQQGIRIVANPDAASGLAGSVKCAIAGLSSAAKGVMIIPGDMPALTAHVIRRIAMARQEAQQGAGQDMGQPGIFRPFYVPSGEGERRDPVPGNPVLWDRFFLDAFSSLEGDEGARQLFRRFAGSVHPVYLEDPAIILDVDLPEDLARAESLLAAHPGAVPEPGPGQGKDRS